MTVVVCVGAAVAVGFIGFGVTLCTCGQTQWSPLRRIFNLKKY